MKMSTKDRMILPFVTLKIVPEYFDFVVHSYQLDKETKFGKSDFLNGEFIQNSGPKKTDKLHKGMHLLRLSATAYTKFNRLKIEHLDNLIDKIVTFEKHVIPNSTTVTLIPNQVRDWTDGKSTKG